MNDADDFFLLRDGHQAIGSLDDVQLYLRDPIRQEAGVLHRTGP